jgi:hypothetical protein
MTGSSRGRRVLLDGWPLLLALVLCLPLLTHAGYPLARDLVFVPRQPLTEAALGLGDGTPRAVPLDALVSAATQVVDGGALARVLLPLFLAAAGWGAHRLVGRLGTVPRLVAGGLAIWNPYVVERLALGQWALLAAYAALPWLVLAAVRWRDRRHSRDLAAIIAWLALASITPTGGLLGAAAVLVTGLDRSRRTWWLVPLATVLQLPWLLPSLTATSGLTSDPAGVAAFAADADGPGGVLVSLLGLGGVWDGRSVPLTRTSWWTLAAAALAVLALVLARRRLTTLPAPGRLLVLSASGLLLAALPALPGGTVLLETLVEHVPGAGLLRDSQKFLAPYVLLVVAATAAAVDLVQAWARGAEARWAVALAGVALPLAVLPDATTATWPTVAPVRFPPGLDTVAAELAGAPPGAVATLPWRSYRNFSWGHGETSSDPALRWYDREVLVSDDLAVGRTVVRGENRRTAALGRALAQRPTSEALRQEGVRYALVYLDDPDAPTLDLSGLERRYADGVVALYAVPGVEPRDAEPHPARRLVLAGDALAGLLVLGSVLALLIGAATRSRRRERHHTRGGRLTPS